MFLNNISPNEVPRHIRKVKLYKGQSKISVISIRDSDSETIWKKDQSCHLEISPRVEEEYNRSDAVKSLSLRDASLLLFPISLSVGKNALLTSS